VSQLAQPGIDLLLIGGFGQPAVDCATEVVTRRHVPKGDGSVAIRLRCWIRLASRPVTVIEVAEVLGDDAVSEGEVTVVERTTAGGAVEAPVESDRAVDDARWLIVSLDGPADAVVAHGRATRLVVSHRAVDELERRLGLGGAAAIAEVMSDQTAAHDEVPGDLDAPAVLTLVVVTGSIVNNGDAHQSKSTGGFDAAAVTPLRVSVLDAQIRQIQFRRRRGVLDDATRAGSVDERLACPGAGYVQRHIGRELTARESVVPGRDLDRLSVHSIRDGVAQRARARVVRIFDYHPRRRGAVRASRESHHANRHDRCRNGHGTQGAQASNHGILRRVGSYRRVSRTESRLRPRNAPEVFQLKSSGYLHRKHDPSRRQRHPGPHAARCTATGLTRRPKQTALDLPACVSARNCSEAPGIAPQRISSNPGGSGAQAAYVVLPAARSRRSNRDEHAGRCAG